MVSGASGETASCSEVRADLGLKGVAAPHTHREHEKVGVRARTRYVQADESAMRVLHAHSPITPAPHLHVDNACVLAVPQFAVVLLLADVPAPFEVPHQHLHDAIVAWMGMRA